MKNSSNAALRKKRVMIYRILYYRKLTCRKCKINYAYVWRTIRLSFPSFYYATCVDNISKEISYTCMSQMCNKCVVEWDVRQCL